MIGLEATYIAVMALGLVWVVSRIISYLRNQREMESRWNEAMYDEGFSSYLAKLKEHASGENETDNGDKPAPGGAPS